jgi:hypothetical protein
MYMARGHDIHSLDNDISLFAELLRGTYSSKLLLEMEFIPWQIDISRVRGCYSGVEICSTY